MSIVAEQLTKVYGQQVAVDKISFSASPGNVLGFLGLNGAGKSTTMKVLSCFIPPTSGIAWVNGCNILKNPLQARKSLGYLPEHNPLYLSMYVKESLEFMAGIHRISQAKKRIAEVITQVGLGPEQHKKVGSLSKGFRQRLGLAQAILHDPPVLILDEPTSGLDPSQLVSIRKLIKDLAQHKTVVLSTHIMQEVEALCEHVIIIHEGRIIIDSAIAALKALYPGNSLEAIFIKLTKAGVCG